MLPVAYIDFHKGGGPYLLKYFLNGGGGGVLGVAGVSCWGCAWCDLRVVRSNTLNGAVLTIIETSIFFFGNTLVLFKQKLGFIA